MSLREKKLGLQASQQAVPIKQEVQLQAPYEKAEQAYALTELSTMQNKLRGALALQIMSNTAMLASAEAQFNQVAPNAREEYRKIVQTYAYCALQELMRGE